MQWAAYSLTPTSLIVLLLQTSSSQFLPLSSIYMDCFLPPSFPTQLFLTLGLSSPHRSNALCFYDTLQFAKPVGVHDLINLTTTLIGRCCPHSADDENEAKGDEVTCPKPHSHVTAEAGHAHVLPSKHHSVTPTLQIKALLFQWLTCPGLSQNIGNSWPPHLRTLKDVYFLLEGLLEKIKGEFVSLKVVLKFGQVPF